ncbi:MAG: zinc ribbon domain-containing protein [Candidatus Eremiobacteraeota bacterium]|nr:zinc ribbon domain-containing protein [Candidatus Eremiobacteraeota bacterium]
MATIEFTQNYQDLSTDQGFQFKFFCDRCGNGYMSSFRPNQLGVAGDLLKAAGGLFGGILGNVGNTAFDVQRAVGGPQHDAALHAAVDEIKPKFHQCKRCGTWVCGDVCWNEERQLCKQCAPILQEELASAQATVARQQIYERAQAGDMTHAIDVDTTAASELACPSCHAKTPGGKFCAECGAPLGKRQCANCHAELAPGAKFCAECGTKTAA